MPSAEAERRLETERPAPLEAGAHTIESPTIGTFYRAPAAGSGAVRRGRGRGSTPDTIVCIIEVMKMMNSIPAGMAGSIAEIHVENAAPVEYGQPLFRVDVA